MQVIKHIVDLQTILDVKKKEGLKIGFVPPRNSGARQW
jgi:pantothenate synthetase